METANKYEVNSFTSLKGTVAVTIDATNGSSDLYQLMYEYKRMFFLMTGKVLHKAIVLVGEKESKETLNPFIIRNAQVGIITPPNYTELHMFGVEWRVETNRNPAYANLIVILDITKNN